MLYPDLAAGLQPRRATKNPMSRDRQISQTARTLSFNFAQRLREKIFESIFFIKKTLF